LSKDKTAEVWDPDMKPEVNDSAQGFRGEHTLLVKQVVLGSEAKDGEVNEVEVEAMGYRSDVKFPVAVLKGGGQHQAVLDLLFPDPPVTFKLTKGNGPIHLLGNHSVGSGEGITEEEDEELEEEFEDEEITETPEKNNLAEKKRKLAQNNAGSVANAKKTKRAKGDTNEDDE